MIGQLNTSVNARRFSDYLFVQGIENQMEADKDGQYAVWIHEEEKLEQAKGLLAAFQQNPEDPKYQGTTRVADDLREQKRKEQLEYEKRVKKRRNLFRPMTAYGFGPVTFTLILMCVGVFVLSKYGYDFKPVYSLFISQTDVPGAEEIGLWAGFIKRITQFNLALPEIRHGDVWRLFTPAILHRDILHIFFNMLWLRDLGSMIEARQSSWLLMLQVLIFAAVSNLAQYLVIGPAFLGMSGVIYGLLGYIWIRGKYDPGSGLYLHPTTVTMMIVWFFACLIGFQGGNIANTAHAVGLIMGISWGFLSSLRHR